MNLTPEQIKKHFPGASKSCLEANADLAARQESQPVRATPPAHVRFSIQPSTDEDRLNKTERAFLAWLRAQPSKYPWIGIQCVTLKLGFDCRFTPDFIVVTSDGNLVFIDTKAVWKNSGKPHVEDDARAKMANFAHRFTWARFAIAFKGTNGWEINEIKP